MIKKLKDKVPIRFVHLIDHDGTIFQLIKPLARFSEHEIITSFNGDIKGILKRIDKLSQEDNTVLILHATGNKKYFYNIKQSLFAKFKFKYIFLHVSPKHFIIKSRKNELNRIRRLCTEKGIKILTPSKEVGREFLLYGIKTIPIQVGVDLISSFKNKEFPKHNGKLVTICTSKDKKYQKIKGIDIFCKLVKNLNLEKESIILGANLGLRDIQSKRVNFSEFINILKGASAYLQFSKTEAYNLSAIYAKQLKIPVIVSDIEGHRDNIKYGFRVKNISEAKKCLMELYSNSFSFKIKKIIEKNYRDTLGRENLNNFRNSFKKLYKHEKIE